MSSTKRRGGSPGGNGEAIAVFSFVALALLIVLFTWVPLHAAAQLDGTPAPAKNPAELVAALIQGDVDWSTSATVIAAGLAGLVVIVAGLAGRVAWKVRQRRSRVDRAASLMGRGRSAASLSRREVQKTATRLGISGDPGIRIATAVATGQDLWQDWETVSVDVWGPRQGKTTARTIPAVVAGPGAVVATTNKRDLVDATRGPRAAKGNVWVFDPQGLVDEPVNWWWNPLTYVTDETKAAALADVFASASRKPGAKTDAYFDTSAVDLIANFLLAAALGGRPITQVYLWITDPNDDEPAQILAAHGYDLPAASVRGVVGAPDKQRAGVYGTAQQVCSFLTNRQATAWVTPGRGSAEFRPTEFVQTTDTLYSLSKEGRGNAGPLVTALTVAVCEAAEDHAKHFPHGRLPVPMVVVLDEAANVCRWNELPNLYSHYGSRGISILTFLQSWSQGMEVWGRDGMQKLWSAATVKVFGSNVTEVAFLEDLSRLIGEYQHVESSTSSSGIGRGRSTSLHHKSDRILDVADLGSLPRGRAVVFAAGAVPVLASTRPWWDGHHADEISNSIKSYDPGARKTS